MPTKVENLAFAAFILTAILSIRNPTGENVFRSAFILDQSDVGADDSVRGWSAKKANLIPTGLMYDFYTDTCPNATTIVRSTMSEILKERNDTTAALLRLLFHDCFIEGCDASVMLGDSNGNRNKSIERQAIPNKTLKGFDTIDKIKEELEKACPGVVSCADTLVLASRDSIHMAGGPFYLVFTGRRDSTQSYYDVAKAEIPKPDGDINETLLLFSQRGFDARETVSLLGAHNVGKIGCQFIQSRLNNFKGTGRPDPTLTTSFLNELKETCQDNNSSDNSFSPTPISSRKLLESSNKMEMTYYHELSTAIPSWSGLDSHYYRGLINNRGLLFADQQLMADDRTRGIVIDYASDAGSTFRRDFVRAMFKLSNLNVLTGQDGVVRLQCNIPVN
ncbi:unnamed protein product [Rhodiola kirilowii]